MPSRPHGVDGEQASSGSQKVNENVVQMIGIVSGVMNLIALTVASFIVFPDGGLVYGVLAGLFAGFGSYFFVPWVILTNAETEQSGVADAPDQGAGGVQVGALGLAFEAAGIGMFALRFVVDEPLVGIGAGVAIALVVYLPASILFTSQ